MFWLHFSSGLLGIEREVGDIRFFLLLSEIVCTHKLCFFLPEVSSLADILVLMLIALAIRFSHTK